MSKTKVDEGAFKYYVALGAARSYALVAQKYGVNKRTILRLADREKWSDRLAVIKDVAAKNSDTELAAMLAVNNSESHQDIVDRLYYIRKKTKPEIRELSKSEQNAMDIGLAMIKLVSMCMAHVSFELMDSEDSPEDIQ